MPTYIAARLCNATGFRIPSSHMLSPPRQWCVVLALPGLFVSRPADACGPTPYAEVRDIQPANGSADLPLNSEIRVLYFGTFGSASRSCDLTKLRLLPEGGSPLELSGTRLDQPHGSQAWIVAKPSTLLLPHTTYDVQVDVDLFGACTSDMGSWRTVSTFTTGSESDTLPPDFAGVRAFSYGDPVEQNTDCGFFKAVGVLPDAPLPTDSSQDIRYHIYVDGVLAIRYVESIGGVTDSPVLSVDCGSDSPPTLSLPSDAQVEVRAVDVAGNESGANSPIQVAARCDPTEQSDEPTCSVTTAPRQKSGVFAALILLFYTGLLTHRRRRGPLT